MTFPRPYLLLSALLFSAAAAGCSRSDAKDLPEWTPADHDNQQNPQAGQVDTSQERPGMPDLAKVGITDVVLATWKQNCVPCHGVIGRGDGPQAAAVRPRDLTDPKWQRVALDSEIEYTIKKGRGRMPAFAQIPDETVAGLISLIRMLNSERPAEAEAAPAADAPAADAPAPSAASQTPAAAAPAPVSPHP